MEIGIQKLNRIAGTQELATHHEHFRLVKLNITFPGTSKKESASHLVDIYEIKHKLHWEKIIKKYQELNEMLI